MRLAAIATLTCTIAAHAATIPDRTYTADEVHRIVGWVPSSTGRVNFPAVYNGYLLFTGGPTKHTPTAGAPDPIRGCLSICDISDPFQPKESAFLNVGGGRMPNGWSISGQFAYIGGRAHVVDLTNPVAPVLRGSVATDIREVYCNAVQWPYLYQAADKYHEDSFMRIVDVRDPAKPVIVKTVSRQALGNIQVGGLFPVGNLLVITAGASVDGHAVLDISDPVHPKLLDQTGFVSYGGGLAGNRLISRGGVFDVSDPLDIKRLSSVDCGYYPLAQQDTCYGTLFGGVGQRCLFWKIDLTTFTKTTIHMSPAPGVTLPFKLGNAGIETIHPIGNLLAIGNYGNFKAGGFERGVFLVPSQTARDTTPPTPGWIQPNNGATLQPVGTRIGVVFDESIDNRTLTTANITVRPVGGAAITGRFSYQSNIVNFTPTAALKANTTYEIVIKAGGVTDVVGNAVATTVVRTFSTGAAINPGTPLVATVVAPAPSLTGANATFAVSGAAGSGTLRYAWDFGDGTDTGFSTTANVSHVFAAPGRYQVLLRVKDDVALITRSFVHIAHDPLASGTPRSSSTIVRSGNRVWVVNTDADTIAAIDPVALTRTAEIAVGDEPRTLAVAADGTLWVVNQAAASISVINTSSNAVVATIPLRYGARPFGIVAGGNAMYVTLQDTGRLLRLDATTRAITGDLAVGAQPRGLALSADGTRLLVSRFLSPSDRGEVAEVALPTWTLTRTVTLAMDPGEDQENSGRGVPNYLAAPAFAPSGKWAWVPAKKDNIVRGAFRDGLALDSDNTVRAMVARIGLTGTPAEALTQRIDIDNSEQPAAVCFSVLGDTAFVAEQGNNRIAVLDAARANQPYASLPLSGRAPQGVLYDAATKRLFVQQYMSRSVSVLDVAAVLAGTATVASELKQITTIATEPLTPAVLLGKRVFYNAADPRMNTDGYLTCATCHLDGGHDGRVWDFTDRGEGLRNTTDLRGRRGMGHGRVHWSANFDEIQDFEHDIRGAFGGDGFLSDADFTSGNRNQPLGGAKAGRSAELDALAAYVASLNEVGDSPHRTTTGALTSDGVAGRALFSAMNCMSCHGGADFTDSASGALHQIGTIRASSGKRLGQTLTGIDTPTLRGLWNGAPYLHDGAATILGDVFTTANAPAGTAHAVVRSRSLAEQAQLLAFLRQIDDGEPAVPSTDPGALPGAWTGADIGAVGAVGSSTFANGTFTISGSGADIWGKRDEFRFVAQPFTGDGVISARVVSQTNTNTWAKAGVMIRDGLAADARHAMTVVTPGQGISFQRRWLVGGASAHTAGPKAQAPHWVRLTRSGAAITGSSSADGVVWQTIGTTSISMPAAVQVGLCVTSHADGVLSTAVFTNVSVVPTAGG